MCGGNLVMGELPLFWYLLKQAGTWGALEDSWEEENRDEHDTVFKHNFTSNLVTKSPSNQVTLGRETIEHSSVKKNSEEMAQQLRVLMAFPKNLSSIPNTNMAAPGM